MVVDLLPQQCFLVLQGDPHHTIDGLAVADEGDKTSCGATLMPTATNFTCG
jgi:uncharacterized Zn-binding protein involved in type VI secretion